MLKALLRKQFAELGSFYVQNKKTGQKRSKKASVGMIVLFVFLAVALMASFFGMGMLFAEAFVGYGFDWLYFAMVGMIACSVGVIGEVFMTSSMLYRAKDNELLLSMPIPPSKILLARMMSIYISGMAFILMVMLPMTVTYWIKAGMTVLNVLLPLLLMPVSGFLVLGLTCILGWVVALVSSRLRNKSVTTVLLSLVLLGVYYVCYFRLNTMLESAAEHADDLSRSLGSSLNPFYHMGRAGTGNVPSFLLFTALAAVIFGAVYYVLSKTFIRIVTMKTGEKAKAYTGGSVRAERAEKALLKRELRHFVSSPAYMLNMGLGLLILPAAGVAAYVKRADLMVLTMIPGIPEGIITGLPVIAAAALCLIVSMDAFTAPSVSLEGKNLWIVRSMPVDTVKILNAKILMQIILNVLPASSAAVLLGLSIGTEPVMILMMVLFVNLYNALSAYAGLAINLLKPNLDWANETVVIKQGASVMFTLFGGWLFSLILAGGYILCMKFLPVKIYFSLCMLLFIAGILLLKKWIGTKGVKRFEEL